MVSEREIADLIEREEAIELGKVVFLKSGGPPMTVRSMKERGVQCEWFDKTNRLRTRDFVEHSLTGRQPLPSGKPAGLLVIGNLDPDFDPNEPQKK